MNVTASVISRSSARADDEGVNNNIFYLYCTFKTENEICPIHRHAGQGQPTQPPLDGTVAVGMPWPWGHCGQSPSAGVSVGPGGLPALLPVQTPLASERHMSPLQPGHCLLSGPTEGKA